MTIEHGFGIGFKIKLGTCFSGTTRESEVKESYYE